MRIALAAATVVILLPSFGCEIGPKSGAGLRLPNGDVVAGELAFSQLGCVECHTIANESDEVDRQGGNTIVALGGSVPHIETHGELVTSIVNPSHGFSRFYPLEDVTAEGDSKMSNFNERMTVKQLIDLTAYLQSKYKLTLNKLYDQSA